jgi:hypothetical protein
MRSAILMFGLLVSAMLPGSALAVVPGNDSSGAAAPLAPEYATPVTITIPPDSGAGGWVDATSTEDSQPDAPAAPSCFGSPGIHSMWYVLMVPEPSVLKVTFSSEEVSRYRPLVTILNVPTPPAVPTEVACALGGRGLPSDKGPQGVVASSYVPSGTYWIRIASALSSTSPDDSGQPNLHLSEILRDVTPPQINVTTSKIVGPHQRITFDATGSTDAASGVNPATATWTFKEAGAAKQVQGSAFANPMIATHVWNTAGFHQVSLSLADNGGNVSTYTFNVLVHSFARPKVSMRVLAPRVGARHLRIVLTHDQAVRVRLVVEQGTSVLANGFMKVVTGSRPKTVTIPLSRKLAKAAFVYVSGTAGDLSSPSNVVALRTCAVRPGKAGGTCA